MPGTLTLAINGDMTAFSRLYADNYKKLYYVAYHSLANTDEAVEAVKTTADQAYAEIGRCKTEEEFGRFMLKKLCSRIILRYREYRTASPGIESNPPYIKAQMSKLTDAERLSVSIWSVYGFGSREISELTGIAEEVVAKKLESGKNRIASKL